MTSIFHLKTSPKELSSANTGISSNSYDKVAPSRDVTLSNFSNGQIRFTYNCSGSKWWVPSRSYLRTRFKITKANGVTPVTLSDGVAPNMGLCSNLFQSAEIQIGGKTVSRISDYMASVDALENRLSKSKAWLDSTGSTGNFWQSEQTKRLQEVSSDGVLVSTELIDQYEIKTQAELPTPVANVVTVAYAVATGEVTFSAGAFTNVNFRVGDYLVITGGNAPGAVNVLLEIIAVPVGVLTLTVRASPAANIAAAALPFSRYRRVNSESESAGTFEVVWQPPLSLFKLDHALPCGFDLLLNPQTSTEFQRRAIESVLGVNKVPVTDFQCIVQDMYLYVNNIEGDRYDDGEFLLDLETTRCQADKIQNSDFGSRQFDISPSSYALTVAFQDGRVGSNTSLSASKFKAYDNTGLISVEKSLNRFFVNYAGRNVPSPDADPQFVAGTNYATEMYLNTILNSGSYFSEGGSETLAEYNRRGSFYYYPWARDGSDRSTRVQINTSFSVPVGDNTRVLLFDHARQACRIRISQGRVVDVALEDQ